MRQDNRLPNYVYLYFLCQSINLIVAVIAVSIVATVGKKFSINEFYITVPYGVQFLFLLVATYPVALLMKAHGRRLGFIIGVVFLALAGIVGFIALVQKSFFLLILAHGFIGLFSACANFYRFAVTDGLPASLQPKALSLVVAGGVLAAILGPFFAIQLRDIGSFPSFSLCYGFLVILALINLGLIFFLPQRQKKAGEESADDAISQGRDTAPLERKNTIFLSISVAAFGYFVMNLMMIQSSLQMGDMHIAFKDASFSIQWHVIAMFLPSFFTGRLIARFGHMIIILFGLLFFLVSFAINIQMVSYMSITIALIFLGLGWNFTYVGGSAFLTFSLQKDKDFQKWQGVGDTMMAVFAMIGAFSPSLLFSSIGWVYSNLFGAFLCLMLLGIIAAMRLYSQTQ